MLQYYNRQDENVYIIYHKTYSKYMCIYVYVIYLKRINSRDDLISWISIFSIFREDLFSWVKFVHINFKFDFHKKKQKQGDKVYKQNNAVPSFCSPLKQIALKQQMLQRE